MIARIFQVLPSCQSRILLRKTLRYLADRNAQSRQVWVTLIEEGVRTGVLRADLDVTLTYRFIRDTVWVAVRWYRPGGGLSHTDVADQYVRILLDGISNA